MMAFRKEKAKNINDKQHGGKNGAVADGENVEGWEEGVEGGSVPGGDHAFAEGSVIQWWVEVLVQYSLRMACSKRLEWRWMVAVIQKLWDVAWDLWEQLNGIRRQC